MRKLKKIGIAFGIIIVAFIVLRLIGSIMIDVYDGWESESKCSFGSSKSHTLEGHKKSNPEKIIKNFRSYYSGDNPCYFYDWKLKPQSQHTSNPVIDTAKTIQNITDVNVDSVYPHARCNYLFESGTIDYWTEDQGLHVIGFEQCVENIKGCDDKMNDWHKGIVKCLDNPKFENIPTPDEFMISQIGN